MNPDFILTTSTFSGNNLQSQVGFHRSARTLFNQAYRKGLARSVWGKLSGRSMALRTLTHQPVTRQSSHSQRITYVPVNLIVGSESRSDDFDNQFNPLKPHLLQRWVGIALARRSGVVLPPVELIRVGDEYYVRDGHHRISVAKMWGQLDIEAVIVN
jgi:hypothetical protein